MVLTKRRLVGRAEIASWAAAATSAHAVLPVNLRVVCPPVPLWLSIFDDVHLCEILRPIAGDSSCRGSRREPNHLRHTRMTES